MNEKGILEQLNNLDKRLTLIENKINLVNISQINDVDFTTLAEISSTEVSDLRRIFDIFNSELNLIMSLFENENNRIKIQNVAVIVLLCFRYVLKKEIVLSSEILQILKTQNISLSNYRTYMREISFDLSVGVEGEISQDYSYRLTNNGEKKAIDLISKIFGSD